MNPAIRLVQLAIVLLVLCCAAVALSVPLPHPMRMTRLSGALNLGHFVLFALVMLCFVWALQPRRWLALLLTIGAAGALEAGQAWVGRSANMADFVRGVLGAATVWAILAAARRPFRLRRAVLWAVVGLCLTAWPVKRAVPYLLDAWNEYRSFPVLCDFESRWQSLRWLTGRAHVNRVSTHGSGKDWAGQIVVPGSGRSRLLVFFPLVCDWTDYRSLDCEFSVVEHQVPVSIKLRTGHTKSTRSRMLVRSCFAPGRHHIHMELKPPENGPAKGTLHLSEVHSVYFGIGGGQGPSAILIHRIYLAQPVKPTSTASRFGRTCHWLFSFGSRCRSKRGSGMSPGVSRCCHLQRR